jgi:hypothetical protein
MADAEAALERLRQRILAIGQTPEAIAPEVAREAKAIIDRNIANGQGPDGKPWKPTKKGEKPLRGAAAAVSARADGSRVVLTLTGPEALHHLGWARGGVVRQILPYRNLPAPFLLAIKRAVAKHVARSGGG